MCLSLSVCVCVCVCEKERPAMAFFSILPSSNSPLHPLLDITNTFGVGCVVSD